MKRLSSIFINTADNLKLIIVSTEFGRAEVVNDALECVWMTARFTVIVVWTTEKKNSTSFTSALHRWRCFERQCDNYNGTF